VRFAFLCIGVLAAASFAFQPQAQASLFHPKPGDSVSGGNVKPGGGGEGAGGEHNGENHGGGHGGGGGAEGDEEGVALGIQLTCSPPELTG
jgi:hypothetical protein